MHTGTGEQIIYLFSTSFFNHDVFPHEVGPTASKFDGSLKRKSNPLMVLFLAKKSVNEKRRQFQYCVLLDLLTFMFMTIFYMTTSQGQSAPTARKYISFGIHS